MASTLYDGSGKDAKSRDESVLPNLLSHASWAVPSSPRAQPWRRKGPTSGSASTIRASWRRSSRGTSSSSPSTSHNTRRTTKKTISSDPSTTVPLTVENNAPFCSLSLAKKNQMTTRRAIDYGAVDRGEQRPFLQFVSSKEKPDDDEEGSFSHQLTTAQLVVVNNVQKKNQTGSSFLNNTQQ